MLPFKFAASECKITLTQQLSILVVNSALIGVFRTSLHFPRCAFSLDNHGVLGNKPNVTEYTVRTKRFRTVFFLNLNQMKTRF